MINTLLWGIAWVGPLVTLANLVMGGGYFPFVLTLLAGIIQGGYAVIYLVGAYRNMLDVHISKLTKFLIYIFTYILLPFSSIIEGSAVVYSIVSPVKTFDVVKK